MNKTFFANQKEIKTSILMEQDSARLQSKLRQTYVSLTRSRQKTGDCVTNKIKLTACTIITLTDYNLMKRQKEKHRSNYAAKKTGNHGDDHMQTNTSISSLYGYVPQV